MVIRIEGERGAILKITCRNDSLMKNLDVNDSVGFAWKGENSKALSHNNKMIALLYQFTHYFNFFFFPAVH